MPGTRHGPQCSGVDSSVPCFHEERDTQVPQAMEQFGHHLSNSHVRTDWLVDRPLAKFDIGGFAQIIESKADGAGSALRPPSAPRSLPLRLRHNTPHQKSYRQGYILALN